jgi:hypothetical protein
MRFIALLAPLLLWGCSHQVQDYQQQTPTFHLPDYFNGSLNAYGVVKNWQGKQNVRFEAKLCGQWQGNEGTLFELFHFSDGRVEQRIWQLAVDKEGKVTGSAADVTGQATGQQAGNTLYWEYVLQIPDGDGVIEVKVEDWLYLVTPQQLMNQSTLYKFGLPVGEIILSIQQQDPTADCSALEQQLATLRAG